MTSSSDPRPRAVVVGAGVGGLAAARGLQLAGWSVRVLEKAGELAPLGAGISLWPNAVRALDALEVPLDQGPGHAGPGGIRRQDGRWLSRTEPADFPRRYGAPLVAVHRADLQQALLASLHPDTLTLGASVTDIRTRPDAMAGRDRDGAGETDLVVVADGLNSSLRHLVAGPRPKPRYAGYTAWRGLSQPDGSLHPDAPTETWGRGERFGIVPLADGRTYWFATASTPPGQSSADGELAEVIRRFSAWHAPIGQILHASDSDGVLRHDVYDVRPHPVTYVRGRVLLLGDAAHAMTPNLGQGACQALEDAATLGAVTGPGADVDDALRRYDTLRRTRAHHITVASRRVGRVGQLTGPAASLRDLVVPLLPGRITDRQLGRSLTWSPPAEA